MSGCKFGMTYCDVNCNTGKEPTTEDCRTCAIIWHGIRVQTGLERVEASVKELVTAVGTAQFTLNIDE